MIKGHFTKINHSVYIIQIHPYYREWLRQPGRDLDHPIQVFGFFHFPPVIIPADSYRQKVEVHIINISWICKFVSPLIRQDSEIHHQQSWYPIKTEEPVIPGKIALLVFDHFLNYNAGTDILVVPFTGDQIIFFSKRLFQFCSGGFFIEAFTGIRIIQAESSGVFIAFKHYRIIVSGKIDLFGIFKDLYLRDQYFRKPAFSDILSYKILIRACCQQRITIVKFEPPEFLIKIDRVFQIKIFPGIDFIKHSGIGFVRNKAGKGEHSAPDGIKNLLSQITAVFPFPHQVLQLPKHICLHDQFLLRHLC